MSASTEKKNRQAAREAGTDKKTLAQQEEARKKAVSKRRWTLGTIGVILLIVAILVVNFGQGYYLSHNKALTIGDRDYSTAEVGYLYAQNYMSFANQYGSYASMFGLDTSGGLAGLKSQACPMMEEGTWRDYFLDEATQSLLQTKAMCDYAAENGIELTEDEIAAVETNFDGLEEYAKSAGFSSVKGFLAANYGTGVTQDLVRRQMLDSSLATKVYNQVQDSLSYTDEQLEDYYRSVAEEEDRFDFAVYHVAAETVETEKDGETVQAPTDQTMAEAQATADAIVMAYKDGEEDAFTERFQVAVDSQLEGQAPTERSRVAGSSLPADYAEWLRDSARKAGDVTSVKDASEAGYYVVVFLGRDDNHYPVAQVRHILIQAEADADGNYTDEAKAAAKARAEEILAEWEAGDKTEESFATLANLYSQDPGSNTNGGLYDQVYKGQMVGEFDAFCFEGHKPGDTGIVYGDNGGYAGYHVLYYVGEGDLYSNILARNELSGIDMSDFVSNHVDLYEAVPGPGLKRVG